MVYQQNSNEALKCPMHGPSSADKSGPYQSFLSRVCVFRTLNLLPVPLSHLTDHITVDDMVFNEAKWHKSCYNKFGMDRLDRVKRKRKIAIIKANSGDVSNAKRKCSRRQSLDKNVCIFCEYASGRLHQFSTLQSHAGIRMMAKDLRDASLLAKIDGGDLIALEAKYHLSCLATLRNRHRSHVRGVQSASEDSFEKEKMDAKALAELLTHIESSVEEGNFFFKLSEL